MGVVHKAQDTKLLLATKEYSVVKDPAESVTQRFGCLFLEPFVYQNVLAKTEKLYILDIDCQLFITVPGDVDKEVMIEVACVIYLANHLTRMVLLSNS